VHLQTRVGGVLLYVIGGSFGYLLQIPRKLGQAFLESVGNEELHKLQTLRVLASSLAASMVLIP